MEIMQTKNITVNLSLELKEVPVDLNTQAAECYNKLHISKCLNHIH